MNFCTKCGNPLKPDARFCGRCGEAITQVKKPEQPQPAATLVCRSCGAGINPGVKFCITCGAAVAFSAPPPPDKMPPPVNPPVRPKNVGKQPPVIQKRPRKRLRKFLIRTFNITVILSAIMAGFYFYGTYKPDAESTMAFMPDEEKYDPIKIDSAATVVENVFAASDTAGLASILSPASLEQKRQFFPDLLPHMPAYANDFKNRKLLYATARYAVYEFSSAEGKFTAEFCLGDKEQWMLMNF